jgi:hypothetical protein
MGCIGARSGYGHEPEWDTELANHSGAGAPARDAIRARTDRWRPRVAFSDDRGVRSTAAPRGSRRHSGRRSHDSDSVAFWHS